MIGHTAIGHTAIRIGSHPVCRLSRAYTQYSAFTKGMSDEKRKPKNENRNRRTPRPIRSDPTDRDPRSRDRARGRWVCVRTLILLRVVTQLLVLVRMRRVESIDRKGSGRLESIDRKGSGRSIEKGSRVDRSIDRSIEKGRSGRVGSGRGGSRRHGARHYARDASTSTTNGGTDFAHGLRARAGGEISRD